MSDLNNIDKLLKDSFADFTPDAPDVWQGVQQGVQAAQAGQVAGSAAAVKGTSLVVKIIATVAISASVVTGYILLTPTNESAEPNTTVIATNPQVEVEETPAVVNEPKGTTILAQETPATTQTGKGSPPPHKNKVVSQAAHAEVDFPPTPPQPMLSGLKEPVQQDVKVPEKTVVSNNPPSPVSKENAVQASNQEEESTDDQEQPSEVIEEKQEDLVEPTIPNVFSPNGDGKNDKFVIVIENETTYYLTIMDKNGNKVFESYDKNTHWDGKDYKSGAVCPAGVYHQIFRYKLKGAQSERTTAGTITLIN
ncbi:MAG: gliding motility-associated C-terminal domain-containing protein [Bacteroidota bacterium]